MLAVLALLLVESVSKADPKSTAKQDAENCNNDGVGFGAAVFRVIKAWTPIVDVFAVHERTREKGSCAAVWRRWYAMSTFFLGLGLFLLSLGPGVDLRHGLDVAGRLRHAALLQNLAPVHQPLLL